MKTNIMYLLLVVCVASAVILSSAVAQNKRIGTAAGSELLIPVGARDVALSGSAIASSHGVGAIFWNPAGMSRLGKTSAEAEFTTMSYIADINVTYGGVAGMLGDFGAIGVSIKSLNFGNIPLTTADDPENASGRFYSPSYIVAGLTYSRALTEAIAVGGTAKIISERIDQVNSSGFALDFGIQYSGLVGVPGLQLGVAVKNIGPQMTFTGPGLYRVATSSDGSRPEQRYLSQAASFELPSVVEIGLAYDAKVGDNMNVVVNGSFTNDNLYLDVYHLGGEFALGLESVKIFGRLGGAFLPDADKTLNENIFGATYGAGIYYPAGGIDITVDYAYRSVDFFNGNQVLTVKFGF